MQSSPPAEDELELSLFGPGIGECLVVHLGAGEWMVVDSCLNESRSESVALEYLNNLGVDVANQLKLIVVSHWHDDHIHGITQLMDSAPAAHFVCSAALDCEEFVALVMAGESIRLVETKSGVSEFKKVLDILESKNPSEFSAGPDHWASEGMRLYYRQDEGCTEVFSLSPSPQTITDSKSSMAKLLPKKGQALRRFHATTPNDHSVVLLVDTGSIKLLLGADLEVGRDIRSGWRAIVGSSNLLRLGVSTGFKVPHHGSENAHFDEIWDRFLVEHPHALVAPYARGIKPLPSPVDIARIKSRTDNAYCTVWPVTQSPPQRDKAVDRTMKEVTKSRRCIRKRPGHIRLRAPIAGSPSDAVVETFAGAARL